MRSIPVRSTKAESFYHKVMKQLIFKYVGVNRQVSYCTKEKVIKNRRADVYIELKNNQKIVIEVQHSPISIGDLQKRTEEYNNLEIYVLWILNAKGYNVAEPKSKTDKKKIKISPIELFLHQFYGGRVYYMDFSEDLKRVSPPFALHFSYAEGISKRCMKKKYQSYYIRNGNVGLIPNWKLLCTEFRGHLIARFYDKNVKSIVRKKIGRYSRKLMRGNQNISHKRRAQKKILKKILKKFKNQYGRPLIIECLESLDDSPWYNKSVMKRYKKKIFKKIC